MVRFAAALALALTTVAAHAAPDRPPVAAHHARPAAPTHPAPPAPRHPAPARPAAHPQPSPAPAPAPDPAAPAPASTPAEPAKGSNTGLPLPRFAALKTDEVNLRTGPGLRYPIDWVYKRRDLPVQIEREFEVWRLVADSEGVKGWVHQATLTGRRSFVVVGGEQVMRAGGQDTASAVAKLKPGVVGRLRACDAAAGWCQVQVGEYRGWLKREAFWGIYPGEAVLP